MSTHTAEATETTGVALRRYFKIGPRTRRYRDGRDMHNEMFEAIHIAATMPGYFTPRTEQPLSTSFGVALAWDKNVKGYRLPGEMIYALGSLSPYRLSMLIDQMNADGVTTTGAGEEWFKAHRAEFC